jgi:hypothetical protein
VAHAGGDTRRADSLLNLALRDARHIGDRGGEMDALIGLSGTRSARGPEEPGLATLDSLRRIGAIGTSSSVKVHAYDAALAGDSHGSTSKLGHRGFGSHVSS